MLSLGISRLFCFAIGLLYPTWASFKAVLSPSSKDDTHWLTYWIVYAFLTTGESVLTALFLWIPLYYEMKALLLLWLIMPQTKGAQFVFESYIHPFLVKHSQVFGMAFDQMEGIINSPLANSYVDLASKYGQNTANQAIKYAHQEAERISREQKQGGGAPSTVGMQQQTHQKW